MGDVALTYAGQRVSHATHLDGAILSGCLGLTPVMIAKAMIDKNTKWDGRGEPVEIATLPDEPAAFLPPALPQLPTLDDGNGGGDDGGYAPVPAGQSWPSEPWSPSEVLR